jgi:hypothetical protein
MIKNAGSNCAPSGMLNVAGVQMRAGSSVKMIARYESENGRIARVIITNRGDFAGH